MLIYKDGIVAELTKFFNNISFPESGPSEEFLRSENAYRVSVFKNHNSETEKLESCDPYIENNLAYIVKVVPKTQEEIDSKINIAALDARNLRNMLLEKCDWTQGKDIPESISVPWANYRQALRNVPTQEGFPLSISWPIPPGEEESPFVYDPNGEVRNT